MKVITPGSVAHHTGSKYLGVLVAAKRARDLNELRRGEIFLEGAPPANREKLTTTALQAVSTGALQYQLVERRRPEAY